MNSTLTPPATNVLNEYKGGFGSGRSAEEITGWVQGLPPMPTTASRALKVIDDVNSSSADIARALEMDVTLVAQILRAANSASNTRGAHVSKVRDAVQAVGLRYVKGLVLASVMRHWSGGSGPIAKRIWEHSVGTAGATRILQKEVGRRDVDEFFLAGLLHNLGQVVMLSHPEIGGLYPKVLEVAEAKRISFTEAEVQVIGFPHTLVGALVAEKWGFPASLCRSILQHDDPFNAEYEGDDEARVAVKLASALVGLSYGERGGAGYVVSDEMVRRLAGSYGLSADGWEGTEFLIVTLIREQLAGDVAALGG